MKRISILKAMAMLLIGYGFFFMSCWCLGFHRPLYLVNGYSLISFNSALCFSLVGVSLLYSQSTRKIHRRFALVANTALILIAGVSFNECQFNYFLGLDHLFTQMALSGYHVSLGTMSCNSALGFLLSGLVILFSCFQQNKLSQIFLQLTSLCVSLVGVFALIGYFLDIHFLYNWYNATPISIPTAVGFLMLGPALLCFYKNNIAFEIFHQKRNDKKILFLSALILLAVSTIAGLSGFIISSREDQATLEENLQELLQDKASMLQESINQSTAEMQRLIEDPASLKKILNNKNINQNDSNQITKFLLQSTFSGMQIQNNQGKILYSNGRLVQNPTISIPFNLPYHAQLIWQNGFRLQLSSSINDRQQKLVLEWPLDGFNHIFHTAIEDEHRQVLVCFSASTKELRCLPPQSSKDSIIQNLDNKKLFALNSFIYKNESGVIKHIYNDAKYKLIAYSPFGNQKIGLIIKTNVDELYKPIRADLNIFILILLASISLGAFLLYWQVSPLVYKLHESEAQFRSAFNNSALGMALVSLEGRWVKTNAALCHILGYSKAELLKMDFQSITYPSDLGICLEKVQQVLNGELEHYEVTKRYYHKTGNLIWARVNVSIIKDPTGQPKYFIAQIQDITQQKKLEDELNYRAHFDPLTGLANRILLEHDLNRTIATAERNHKTFAVFFIDLDDFKKVNDSLGHEAGDRLLAAVAKRLKNHTRKSDIVSRLGGDEFVIILPEVSDHETAALFAEKIHAALLEPFQINGQELSITSSIGISFYPSHGTNSTDLVKKADEALYQAKAKGKAFYQFYASRPETTLQKNTETLV